MTDIILVGGGGCMRELIWQIQESNRICHEWNILGYTDVAAPPNGTYITVGKQKIRYLGTDEVLFTVDSPIHVVVAVGNSLLREQIANKLRMNPRISFPTLVLKNATVCEDAEFGKGCIISMNAKISTNVKVGDFVFLNTGSMLCHDDKVGDFVTLSPGAIVAGNVSIGSRTELGMSANVIQGLSIGEDVKVGAGAIVVQDIQESGTYVGVPARKR